MRLALLLVLAACGRPRDVIADAAQGSASADAPASKHDDAPAGNKDAAVTADAAPDAFSGTFDVRINCHNDCTLVAMPASINVHAGTEFYVNWINTGDTDCDVAKIDQFNSVPIVLGLGPGENYDDMVHPWCGAIFTGTFEFEIRICTIPSYIPVNCGA